MSGIDYSGLLNQLQDPNATQNPLFYGVAIPVYIITIPIFFARIYFRSLSVSKLWWDDLFITLGFLIESAAFAIALRVCVVTGGRHIVFIPLPIVEFTLRSGFILIIIAPMANAAIKISLSLMLLRIKGNSFRWRLFLWSMIVVLVLVIIASTLTTVLSCHPISAYWTVEQRLEDGKACWPVKTSVGITYAFGAFFAFTDLIMAILPIAFIRDIRIPFRNKVILCGLMGCGLFAMAAGIAKIFLMRSIYLGDDLVYQMIPYGLFLQLELLMGIIAACIPTLRNPFERWLKRVGLVKTTHTTQRSVRRDAHDSETKMRINALSNNGNRTVDATITTSQSGATVERKDVILVDASVVWESSLLKEMNPYKYLETV